MSDQKSYRELIEELERILDENEKQGLFLQPCREAISEIKRHSANIQAIEDNIDAIRDEVLQPIKSDFERYRKAGRFSELGFYLGAIGLLASIVSFTVGILYPAYILKNKAQVAEIAPYRRLLSEEAYEAFGDPTVEAGPLSGEWVTQWGIIDREANSVETVSTGPLVAINAGAQVSAASEDRTTDSMKWLEGRLSHAGRLTLTYWSGKSLEAREKTGVVFLSQKRFETPDGRAATYFYGRWAGRIVRGRDINNNSILADEDGVFIMYRQSDSKIIPEQHDVDQGSGLTWAIDTSIVIGKQMELALKSFYRDADVKDRLRNAHSP